MTIILNMSGLITMEKKRSDKIISPLTDSTLPNLHLDWEQLTFLQHAVCANRFMFEIHLVVTKCIIKSMPGISLDIGNVK